MIVEFTVSINIEPEGDDKLSKKQYIAMEKLASDLEEVIGINGYELNDCTWEET